MQILPKVVNLQDNSISDGTETFHTQGHPRLRTRRDSGEELYYTFLGRWESRPEERIIDINAPLGKSLVNHKEGDEVHFSIYGKDYDYTVLKIEVIL